MQTSTQRSVEQYIESKQTSILANMDIRTPDFIQDGAYAVVTVYNSGSIKLNNITVELSYGNKISRQTKILSSNGTPLSTLFSLDVGAVAFVELQNRTGGIYYPMAGDSIIANSRETYATTTFQSNARITGTTNVTPQSIALKNGDSKQFTFTPNNANPTTLVTGNLVTGYLDITFSLQNASKAVYGRITLTDINGGTVLGSFNVSLPAGSTPTNWKPTLYSLKYSGGVFKINASLTSTPVNNTLIATANSLTYKR